MGCYMNKWLVLGACAFAFTASAQDSRTQNISETKQYLQQFYKNQGTRKQVMDQRLVKKDSKNKATAQKIYGTNQSTATQQTRQRMVDEKNKKRLTRFPSIKQKEVNGRAGYSKSDDFMNLVDNGTNSVLGRTLPPVRTLEGMEAYKGVGVAAGAVRNLTTAKLKSSPWSDDYWAIAAGVLANRYEEDNFVKRIGGTSEKGWKAVNDYITNPANSCNIKDLSPAEKYDLLVGDKNKTLTKNMLLEGQYYFYDMRNDANKDGKVDESEGKVETWMGICHGWAPAAYMVMRPKAAINVIGVNGDTIPFYPSDIKALASLLWAKGQVVDSSVRYQGQKFIGGRCNTKESEIKKDPKNNRVINQQCFDTNPGTWHLAVVNQVGVSGRSMVLDATFDYEVWNQPIHSYSYTYFKPGSDRSVGVALKDAVIPISEYKNDPFNGVNPETKQPYRDARTKYIVGISMNLTYIVETKPSHTTPDTSAADMRRSVNYVYDLELDANKNIIGGEWYSNRHPDFLWTPIPNAVAITSGDIELKNLGLNYKWKDITRTKLPSEWADAAITSSSDSQSASPLYYIVNELSLRANLAGPVGD